MKLGPPAPRSLLPCELLQLCSTCPCWSNAQDQVRRRGTGCCTARCRRMGVVCFLVPARLGGMARSQLLGCATPLLQNSSERGGAATFLTTALRSSVASASSLASSHFPQEPYLKVPAFHRQARNQAIPQSAVQFLFSPTPKQGQCSATDISIAGKVVSHVKRCRDGGWRCLWTRFLGQAQC